ncbi:MAG: DUF2219 family protein, partial [Sinobacteraceae bacterium]|nr:DUF2219 family protein [Nevskiaceae bacterium]
MRLAVVMSAITLLGSLAATGPDALAGTSAESAEAPSACQRVTSGIEEVSPSEPLGIGAGIVLDEHLLTNGRRDEDYNGGGEVTFSGEHAGPIGRMFDRTLGFIDNVTCPGSRYAAPGWAVGHATAVGLLIFTPKDLAAEDVVEGDRPYASLFFLSAGRRYVSPEARVAYSSSLTFGIMGLDAA